MITPDSVVRVKNQSLVLDVGTITLTTGEHVKGVVADIRIGAPGTPKIAVQAQRPTGHSGFQRIHCV